MRNNRSRVEITADILELTCCSCKPTTIMYKANLSYDQLRSYLAYLSNKGWIVKEEGEWRATERGREYLAVFQKLKEFLKDDAIQAEPAMPASYVASRKERMLQTVGAF
ncbi:MAG: winged helix-turn-helix domain-containing protein [Nitrososphaera sp.]|jgi:predicted transcriptional regulator